MKKVQNGVFFQENYCENMSFEEFVKANPHKQIKEKNLKPIFKQLGGKLDKPKDKPKPKARAKNE